MQDETLTETLSLIDEETPLPEGWKFARLGDVADIVNGFGFSETLQGKKDLPFPFIKVSDMNAEGSSIVISKAANTVDETILKTLRARVYPAGTVIFPKVGGALLTNKKRILGTEATFDNNIMGIVPKTVEKDWIFYWILTVDLKTLANTQALPSIRQSDVANLKIPLPPTIEEQRRIASVLDEQMKAVEQARRAVEEQLKAANRLPNAFLRVVFESEEAQNWQKRRLGDYAKVQSGYAFKTDWYVKDGIRLLRNANVFQGFIDWSDAVKLDNESRPKFSSYELNEGDIVLSLDRPLVSNGLKVAKLQADDVPSLLLQRVGRFLLNDEIDSDYLYTFLNSENFINVIKGHDQSLGVPHISPSQVENIEIPIPPTIEEQKKLTERINGQMQAAETLKKSLTEKLEAVKKLPAALLRKAFAGEI